MSPVGISAGHSHILHWTAQTSNVSCLIQLDDASNYKQVLYPTLKLQMQLNVTARRLDRLWADIVKGSVKTNT